MILQIGKLFLPPHVTIKQHSIPEGKLKPTIKRLNKQQFNIMKPTLLVLAAGMGSRYGALKQMDGVGPNNEAILDYSIYDAKRAGFGKVVFVIREDFAEAFKKVNNTEKFGIPVEYVYQSLDKLPEGFSVPEGRVKPWGTCHAVLMAKDVIHEPFAAINADDFYGKEAYEVLAKYLMECEGKTGAYSMVATSCATPCRTSVQ